MDDGGVARRSGTLPADPAVPYPGVREPEQHESDQRE
jgi:hypothetical protein